MLIVHNFIWWLDKSGGKGSSLDFKTFRCSTPLSVGSHERKSRFILDRCGNLKGRQASHEWLSRRLGWHMKKNGSFDPPPPPPPQLRGGHPMQPMHSFLCVIPDKQGTRNWSIAGNVIISLVLSELPGSRVLFVFTLDRVTIINMMSWLGLAYMWEIDRKVDR